MNPNELLKRKLEILFTFGHCDKTVEVEVKGKIEVKPIANQTLLAKALGVSPQAISQWIDNGSIPKERLRCICEWFGIGYSAFLDADAEAFEAMARGGPGVLRPQPWRDFAAGYADTKAPLRLSPASSRGFEFDDEPKSLPAFRNGDKVYAQLDLRRHPRWCQQARSGQPAYMLVVDMGQCNMEALCPRDSQHLPGTEVNADGIRIPIGHASMTVKEAPGPRSLLTLLTQRALPDAALSQIVAGKPPVETVLDGLAPNILKGWFGEWVLLQYEYQVI
jgi:hypothetical protein